MRALAALDTAGMEHPRPWMLTIVRNTALTWLGKNRPGIMLFTGDEHLFEVAAINLANMTLDAEQTMIAEADYIRFETAIAQLPYLFRETLIMRDINGLSYREISEALDVPIGTVMSRLARARNILMTTLRTVEQ